MRGAVTVAGVFGVSACGDDDGGDETPAPTGANDTPEGVTDVTSSIVDPQIEGSNVAAVASDAPFNS